MTFDSKTIALVDPRWNGHHPTYMKLFTLLLLQKGYRVMVFCPQPQEVTNWITSNYPQQVRLLNAFTLGEPKPIQWNIPGMRATYPTLARWYLTAKAIKETSSAMGVKPDLVFFCWLDGYLYWGYSFLIAHLIYLLANMLFPYQWSGLHLHPYPVQTPVPCNPHKMLESKYCQSIAVLEESSVAKLEQRLNGKRVVIFPDIADEAPPDTTYPLISQITKVARNKKKIGLLGYLEPRKGIMTLLEIAELSINQEWFFVVAGCLKESSFFAEELERLKKKVKSNPPNCYFYFETIPGEPQFNALVNECDVLFAAYENFAHSSNLLTKAAIFKKPVLVSQGFSMEARVKKFRLGLSVKGEDIQEYIDSLACLLDESKFLAEVGEPDFDGYKSRHSVDQLDSALREILNSKN